MATRTRLSGGNRASAQAAETVIARRESEGADPALDCVASLPMTGGRIGDPSLRGAAGDAAIQSRVTVAGLLRLANDGQAAVRRGNIRLIDLERRARFARVAF